MESTLTRTVLRGFARDPWRVALHADAGEWSHAELGGLVRRAAARFSELCEPGTRVGLLLPNLPTFPVALYGLLAAGARVVLLNPLYSAREIAEYIADAGVDRVVTVGPLAGLLPAGTHRILADALPAALHVAGADGERVLSLANAEEAEPVHADPDDEALVVYTAAADGWARGARLSHRNLAANLTSTVEAMQLTPEDRVVAALPLVHTFGLTVTLNAPLSVGASVIPLDRFNPVRLLDLLETTGATVFSGVPAMYLGILSAAARRGVPRHSLRLAICGGAPLAPEVQTEWERVFGFPLRQGYGLTEAAPVCLFNRPDRPNRPGTLGYPFPNVDVRILGERGEPLGKGEVGEICVRGDNVFLGYAGDEGRDPRSFHGDALRTGDLGSEEEDGVIRFRGFLKPMFTRNGFNVYPAEIRRALEEDPRVGTVQVASMPDEARENEIVLVVTPAPGASLDEEEVRELCRTRLAAFKQPLRVRIADVAA